MPGRPDPVQILPEDNSAMDPRKTENNSGQEVNGECSSRASVEGS
jgi:hypothetical protein